MSDSLEDNDIQRYCVGLDLSLTGTGMVIIDRENLEDNKGFKFSAGEAKAEIGSRIDDLWRKISKVLPKDPRNTKIFIEGAAFGASFNTFTLGELNGGIKFKLSEAGYTYQTVAPTSLKKYATGKGVAEKSYVSACVALKWNFISPSNDIVDAFVLARMAFDNWVFVPKEKVRKKTKAAPSSSDANAKKTAEPKPKAIRSSTAKEITGDGTTTKRTNKIKSTAKAKS
jgi:crossover junction endodeoxyribonuclease RuvC